MIRYTYTDRDLLAEREHYFYSAVQGPAFFDAYRAARQAVLDRLADAPTTLIADTPATTTEAAIQTDAVLDALELQPEPETLDGLVQRFEVSKRLYDGYDSTFRKPQGDYRDLMRYARLARLLADEVARSGDLKWLNTLLKLNDLLCSQPAPTQDRIAALLRHSLTVELATVNRLLEQTGGERDA